MKKTTLCSIALVAFIGGGALLPSVASAAPKEQKSEGFIKFNEDSDGAELGDPEKPEENIDKPEITDPIKPNEDRGTFSVDAVTELRFGDTHKVGATNDDRKFFAAPVTAKSNGTDIIRGNYVQFTDKRATLNHKYTLTAQMTRPFESKAAGSSAKLKAADITYTNGVVTSTTKDELWPSSEADGSKLVKTIPTFTLAPDATGLGAGDTVTVIDNKSDDRGIGTYYVEFGQYADGSKEKDTSGKSVELRIPSTVNLTAEEYTADITWTLSEI
ncbi:WxL domain-containing protein [Candidatus Enterococcus mansonii]|uniref:WxL domain-containing protein n=1 Tax=Candidatus Enterococcus mansonii TaxID=1834181 RepID=A0A242CD38_9ENTE|nr:WxL domain-containing protein [Enterococcus sp. 4G2_DIV0659]OTO08157.1 hypothetical protein A5880_002427 [Enterococcus sp. 4G2_DIV0659]